VLLSWILFERGFGFLAGLLLGLCAMKPQLVFMVPLALLIQQRWRMLAGFAFGGVAMVGGSMLLGGWQTLPRYAAFLGRLSGALVLRPERAMNVDAILLSTGLPLPLRSVLMAAVLVAAVLACWRSNWSTGLMAAMVASFLVGPHTLTYDTTALMVGAWLTAFTATKLAVRALAVAFFTPIPWFLQLLDQPWTALPAVLLLGLLLALAWEPARAALRSTALRRVPAPATEH
jgi:hypothetical protein